MENKTGMIKAEPAPAGGGDSSLPDPTRVARLFLGACVVAAVVVAIVADAIGLATKAFEPAQVPAANFALFAGFYVGAQVVERLMEVVSPLLPFWDLPASMAKAEEKVKVAQVKADRAKAALGLALLAGVVLSFAFGLYFLKAIGMDIPRRWDIFFTGLIIAAGTKPLHDFITGLQNKNTPNTGNSVG
jgi:small-conductance mechanosensitive channel